MSTDRKLLELAAKASGIQISWGEKYFIGPDEVDCTDLSYATFESNDESPQYWNPLTEDGDALRLLVELKLSLEINGSEDEFYEAGCMCEWEIFDRDDEAKSVRRAIVRAAAEIGRRMP